MANLGRRLRDAREHEGLRLEEISSRTKISVAALRALEAEQFERLPGDFYIRSFLKTYAREVHLPPDEVVKEFDESRQPPQPVVVDAGTVDAIQEPQTSRTVLLRVPRPSNLWAVAGFTILVLAVVAIVWRQTRSSGPVEAGAVATSGVAAPLPAASTGRTPAPEKLTIDIRPTAPIWVAAMADGQSAIYRLLKPGEHVVLEARSEFSFRIGNAGAFVYTINGVPGKPLGGPDEVREFDITRDNYLTFRR